jgi:hypothetical protein
MSSSSSLYDVLTATATEFVNSTGPRAPGTNEMNGPRMLEVRTADCKATWGPLYLVKARPSLEQAKDNEALLEHMEGITSRLETWSIEIGRIIVDERKLEAVVQADYHMIPVGAGSKEERTVVNDIVWFLSFSDDGRKVATAKEYVDIGASAAIAEIMNASK